MATEFPEGGYNGHPYCIYHRPGLAELVTCLTSANLEWGFWTNQIAQNALPSVRALLSHALGSNVKVCGEAKLQIEGPALSGEVWDFVRGWTLQIGLPSRV